MSIKLIVGLGNPGPQYEVTRHNAGCWFVERLAQLHHIPFKTESKFQAKVGFGTIQGHEVRLCIPITFMNLSGNAVQALAKFYKITPSEILIAHDELDLPPGSVRLKRDGGHGGHNGLRDVFAKLSTKEFYRLRLGVGHPGHRDDVVDFVLKRPSNADRQSIDAAIDKAIDVIPQLLADQLERAMNVLHTD